MAMNKYFLIAIIFFVLALVGSYAGKEIKIKNAANDENIVSASSTITFPKGGEKLVRGNVYTLSWTGGTDPVSIFLVDRSLKDKGTSVAITDRVYGIKNTGGYSYMVPTSTPLGEYELRIGSQTSNPFSIVKQ